MHYNDGHKHNPLQTPGRQRRLSPTTRSKQEELRGVPIPAALGGGVARESLCRGAPGPRRAWPVWPGPWPALVASRESPRPATGSQPLPPCLPGLRLLRTSPAEGDATGTTSRGSCASPLTPASPAAAARGSCLVSPRPPGLLLLSPAPRPARGDLTAARPGGVAARSPEPAEPAKPALLASVRSPCKQREWLGGPGTPLQPRHGARPERGSPEHRAPGTPRSRWPARGAR